MEDAVLDGLHPATDRHSVIAQQPLDIFELELRAEVLAEAAPQLFKNPACALNVDFAGHLHGRVVAVIATAQGTAKRIGFLPSAPWSEPPGLAVRSGAHHALLLHRLR